MLRKLIVFFHEMYQRFFANRVLDMAATCAYFFLLSLFPFLLFAITLLSFLPIRTEQVLDLIQQFSPGFTNEIIAKNINEILSVKRTGLLSIGVLFTIWSSLSGIESLIRALNFSYGIHKERSFIRSKLTSLALAIGMIVVILSILVLTIFGQHIEHDVLADGSKFFNDTIRLLANLVILYNVFSVLYLVAPIKRVLYREVIPGSLFATFGWYFISLGFSYYVENFMKYSATYGSLGGIIITMIWFYLSATILILGGQLNAVVNTMRHPLPVQPHHLRPQKPHRR
jgi:membrane protein